MADSPSYPPIGFDRADGTLTYEGQVVGTPTPAGTVVVKPYAHWLEELPTSPTLERSEQFTAKHSYAVDQVNGPILLAGLPRGTVLADSVGVIWKIVQTSLEYQSATRAILSLTMEAINSDVPPDDYEVDALELNPPLIRHPRYVSLLFYQPPNGQQNGIQIINAIETAINGSNTLQQAENIANLSSITDPTVQGYAKEYAAKRYRGEETWYLPCIQVTWSRYSYSPVFDIGNPGLNPGGYIEDPVAKGGLPAFFWSDTGFPGGNNLLLEQAALKSPMFYGAGLSWLRKSDRITFQRTLFKITHTWVGAPNGNSNLTGYQFSYWDPDIYSPTVTPPNTNLFP